MAKYVDLVACVHQGNNKCYLFEAPEFSPLKSGDQVLVESGDTAKLVDVVEVQTCIVGSPEYKFALAVTGAREPLKRVIAKLTYKIFEYTDGKNPEVGTDDTV